MYHNLKEVVLYFFSTKNIHSYIPSYYSHLVFTGNYLTWFSKWFSKQHSQNTFFCNKYFLNFSTLSQKIIPYLATDSKFVWWTFLLSQYLKIYLFIQYILNELINISIVDHILPIWRTRIVNSSLLLFLHSYE